MCGEEKVGFSEVLYPLARSALKRIVATLKQFPFIFYLLGLVLLLIWFVAPGFYQPRPLLSFLKRSAPIIIVTMGQAIVILNGEIDLSVGSLITVCAVAAAKIIDNTSGNEGTAFFWIFAISIIVGLVNGIVTTRLRVPSFVTTLGMLLILQGAISIWTKGAPKGGITPEFRYFGNASIGSIPVAVILLVIVVIVVTVLIERTTFGRRVYAVGGNQVAARISGVRPDVIKTTSFLLCSVLGAIGAVLVAGFSGVSTLTVGQGYEFQAIAAAVLGGISLAGGRGKVAHAAIGALTLQALFSLLNFLSLPISIRETAEGIIVITAMAISAFRNERTIS